ncbi:hypothetical protein NSQ62_08250 [Solibacillus sp. FSL H8-0523]|uniref:hypothetical protein n=1 Tax=Solibacillus sp. FSL H8-0523 TaxID=2954511 RepID=UPI0031015546
MEFIKKELIDTINSMNDENILEIKQRINRLFEFAELSKSIWGTVPNFLDYNVDVIDGALADAQGSNDDLKFENAVAAEALPKEEESENNIYKPMPLERRLKGGTLRRNNSTLYVPEKIIRTNGWVHGDYITAIGENEQELIFEKHSDSTSADKSNRVELDYCLVTKRADEKYVIKQHYNEGILKPTLLNGVEHEFVLDISNVSNFRLQDGYVVAIAFYANKPHEFRIIWLYTDMMEIPAPPPPKPSSYYKEQNSEKKLKWNDTELKILEGKKIVIVGADFRANDFIGLMDEAKISYRILSGDESDARFEAAVRGKDLIVSLSSHTSHRSSELAKSLAKKYSISFRAAPTSISSVKRAIVHGISAKEIPFHSLF